jgi:hypothetical protein
VAKHAESFWETLTDDPLNNSGTAASDVHTVFISAAIFVVNGEKLNLTLAAARAFPAVMVYHKLPTPTVVGFLIIGRLLRIARPVLVSVASIFISA